MGTVVTTRPWICYFHGQKFVLHSDRHPRKLLETQEFITLRQVCCLEQIADSDFGTVSIKGKSNQIADGSSLESSITTESNEHFQCLFRKANEQNDINWRTIYPYTGIKL